MLGFIVGFFDAAKTQTDIFFSYAVDLVLNLPHGISLFLSLFRSPVTSYFIFNRNPLVAPSH